MSNRCISRIPFGFRVDDLNFRYIPPNTSCRCEFSENEFGDFNYRSNLWINLTNFFAEERFGKPGGLGFTTNRANTRYFMRFPSDHKACLIDLQKAPKTKRQVDTPKLLDAINAALRDEEDDDIYKNQFKKNPQRKLKVLRKNDKIVNPTAENLEMSEWEKLYGHEPNKLPNLNHVCRTRERAFKNIASRAVDINDIPIKKTIALTSELNRDEINKVLFGFRWVRFNSRVICLRKKGKEPNKVTNLRPIQISPFTFKIAEQSRKSLKNWLNIHTSPKCYAFKPNARISDLLTWLKSKIVKRENG